MPSSHHFSLGCHRYLGLREMCWLHGRAPPVPAYARAYSRVHILFHHSSNLHSISIREHCSTLSSMRDIIPPSQSMSSSPFVNIFLAHLLFLWFLGQRKANTCSISYPKPKLQDINNKAQQWNNLQNFYKWGSKKSKWVKPLSCKHVELRSQEPQRKANPRKLPSDPHACTVAYMCQHSHTQTINIIF